MTTENNGMYMPVAPAYGYGGGNGMFGNDGGAWWLLILLIALGGWGNGFGGGYGGGGMFPWLMNGQQNGYNDVQRGFDQSAVISGITGVQNAVTDGFGHVQTALCNGFAGTTAAVSGAQNAIAQQLYAGEIASLNRSFAEQSANTQGFTAVQSGLCDARYASATNTRDIIDNNNRTSQMIMDKLCALELDGVKSQLAEAQRENVGLQNQLNMANLAASQATQTGNIRDAIIGELRSCPIPAQPVYGSQPIFTCGGNNAGCGCNGNFMN